MPGNGELAPEQRESTEETTNDKATSGIAEKIGPEKHQVAHPANEPQQEPEKDEFGLPVKKPRRRSFDEDSGEDIPHSADLRETPGRDANDAANESHEHVKSVDSHEHSDGTPEAVKESEPQSTVVENQDEDRTGEQLPGPSNPPETATGGDPATEEKVVLHDVADTPRPAANRNARATKRDYGYNRTPSSNGLHKNAGKISEYSHQQLAAPSDALSDLGSPKSEEWQDMPALAPYDVYDDDGHLIAREAESDDEEAAMYGGLGGAGKGYTKVQIDEDAQSATSMDDNTAYLFKDPTTTVIDEDDDVRDPLAQMQATKDLLTEGQRIAYVGVAKVAMDKMIKELDSLERTRGAKKVLELGVETMQMWSQKMMLRLYQHMDINQAEQIMIEQLASHGVEPSDLTPALMQNARVKNPVADEHASGISNVSGRSSISGFTTAHSKQDPVPSELSPSFKDIGSPRSFQTHWSARRSPRILPDPTSPPPYQEHELKDVPEVTTPSHLPNTKSLDIDLRWTVLCDLFLVLISDSIYDARSRTLLEKVGGFLSVEWLEICRFEKRVTEALEMQEAADKENWNEEEHMENRRKLARNRRLVMMGLATVGGSLVIGLSAGLLAPVIGAGLAAGFTTIGVAGTGSFLAGAGGAAIVTTTGVVTGGTIGVRAADRRTGAVKTFEYRPLHNNKRVNLIVTVAGWMTGKVDDVRLPFSTVDPLMGDIYSVLWEPEMLSSMGETINILATEALTQGLQQVLGSTILITLMAGLQLPIVLTKLSYLIDNPWNVSLARAEQAGLILADSLIDRNLGARPVTLVGFSLGCRLIFSCLKELARKGAHGLIQSVYMFGSPVVANKDEFLKVRTVVSGRFVNGYATNDWILGYLFRATAGGILRVAGLAPIEIPGIENFDVTEFVPGHMAYRPNMPRLLREVGWLVESDEFTEIEDPDPENHEKRQRELINEIEEARKEIQEEDGKEGAKKKTRFGFGSLWGPKKRAAQKKDWEMYDERTKSNPNGEVDPTVANEPTAAPGVKDERVLFDVDAIRREAAGLASQGVQIKQLESTLPPMKLDVCSSPSAPASAATWNGAIPKPASPQPPALRQTKSYDAPRSSHASHSSSRGSPRPSADGAGGRPLAHAHTTTEAPPPAYPNHGFHHSAHVNGEDRFTMTFEHSSARVNESKGQGQASSAEGGAQANSAAAAVQEPRPGARIGVDPLHNAWADEETEYQGGGGMEITFE